MTDNYHILCDRGLQGGTDFCGAVYVRARQLAITYSMSTS